MTHIGYLIVQNLTATAVVLVFSVNGVMEETSWIRVLNLFLWGLIFSAHCGYGWYLYRIGKVFR